MKRILLVVLAILVVLGLIFATVQWRLGGSPDPGPDPSAPPPPGGAPTAGEGPPEQPAHCADMVVLAVPGTWESHEGDDPHDPTANPNSLLLGVTGPLRERLAAAGDAAGRVEVRTVAYPAEFRNANAPDQMTYDESRAAGMRNLSDELAGMHAECPRTDAVLVGFSQGAVIVGDAAAEIGQGRGPIPPERVRAVFPISDGRRTPDQGRMVGNPVAGVGAEVALQPLQGVIRPIVPGATMRGPREGGFGALSDRVFQICAPDDNVCDAPARPTDAALRARALVAANGVHAAYAANPNVIPGTTAPAWVVDQVLELAAGREVAGVP